jgi:peroxisomal membrane protein 4
LSLAWSSSQTEHKHNANKQIRGLRNGILYGIKVRAPHALVMTLLFHKGTLRQKVETIFKATATHAKNLGLFVLCFKAALCAARHATWQERPLNHLLAGFAAAWVCWGEHNPINSQVNMYILSRILVGSTHSVMNAYALPPLPKAFSVYAASIWAIVMYLYAYQTPHIQSSLKRSMTYLYSDSDRFPAAADTGGSLLKWLWLPSPR